MSGLVFLYLENQGTSTLAGVHNTFVSYRGRGFWRMWLKPIEIGDPMSKVKVTVTQYQFILHKLLLTPLLYISALLYPIEIKFDYVA